MTQIANQSRIVRSGENPYLERVMRLIGIGVSIAVSIFALAGVTGIVGAANTELSAAHNSDLNRIENAIQARLDRYTTDLTSLANDPNLIEHLTGAENVRVASALAGEIIALHLNEYEHVQFIDMREGQPFLAFERVNSNSSVSDVIPYADQAYVAPEHASDTFARVLNGETQSIVLSNFYLLETSANNIIVLEGYVPVYVGTDLAMIINLRIDATELNNIVNLAVGELVGDDEDATSRRVLWLVNNDSIVADSDSAGTNYVQNLNASEGNIDGNEFYEAILNIDGLLAGTTEPIQNFRQNTIYSAQVIEYEALPDLNWRIIVTDTLSVYHSSSIVGVTAIAILAFLTSVVVVVVIKQILRPVLAQVYEADTLIQTSARESNVAIRSVGDQAELVAAARRVTTRLSRLNEDLENETKRRNRDMQIAGRIGRETATLTDLDTLANTTINLICNELGFYHAQIFLLDQSRTYAVLRYSRGEAGKELINRGHQLRVGSDSVIGKVTAEKRPVIVNDTQATDEHAINPLLNETRAEMGLPLLISDTIIGTLDIQSRNAYSFSEDDISTYQLLADQLAVAIYNAQLREQTEQRIGQIDKLNRQLTRDAWNDLENKLDLRQKYGTKNIDEAKLATDISIRGEVIGRFEANLPEGQQFSDADRQILQSVAERVSLALENARLFQETEVALQRQEKLYAASRIINTSQNLSDLVRAAVATASDLNLDFWLALPYGERDKDGWTELVEVIAKSHAGEVEEVSEIHPSFSMEHSAMRRREPEILMDRRSDSQGDSDALQWIRDLGLKFVAMFPLFSDNSPIAIFYIVNQHPYELSQDDYEVYRALTGQMSTQIQNRNLFAQTEETLSEIRRLYVATRAISGAQDTNAIYDAVAGHIAMPFIQQSARLNQELNVSITVLLANPQPDIHAPQLRYEYSWHSDPIDTDTISIGSIISQEDAPFGGLIADNDDGSIIYKHMDDVPNDFPMIREILSRGAATSAIIAPLWSRLRWFGVMIIGTDQPQLLDENYARFVQSIADQVAIAIENQTLLAETQFERQRLNEILQTLPVGVMVLDFDSLEPISINDQVSQLLGQAVRFDEAFSAKAYNIYRAGTDLYYPDRDLPIFAARETRQEVAPVDDISVIHENGQIDLLMSAAPIFDAGGQPQAIVSAFQDISTLRGMERTIQENLRETILLYETQRTLNEAADFEELLDGLAMQLAMQQTADAFVFLNQGNGRISIVRSLMQSTDDAEVMLPLLQENTVNISDVAQETEFDDALRQTLQAINAQSILVAPLSVRTRQEPLGWLMLVEDKPDSFGFDQERLMSSIADMTSQAINNNYLFESTQAALQETSVLYQASKALIETDSPQEIIEVITNYLIEPHVNQVFMAMLNRSNWDSPSAAVEIVASWQSDAEIDLYGVVLSPDEFPAWSILATDTTLIINDIQDEAYQLDMMEQLSIESLGIRSLAVLPLRVPGRAIGSIWLASDETYDYSDRDLRVFQSFAEQTSLSLEAKRLLQQTEERARQLQTSAVISQSVGQILDLNILLPQVVELIRDQFDYDHVQIFLMDEENDWALLTASTGEAGEELLGIGHKLQRGSASVIGQVTEIGKPTIALDTADAEVVHAPNPYLPMTRSEMALPLIVKGAIVGALDVQSNRPNAFAEDDIQVLTTLAAQIAVAIDNARLYEDAEKSAEDMSFLFDITTTAAAAETLRDALNHVAQQIKDNVRSDVVAIYLTQDYEDYYGNRKKMIEVNAIASDSNIQLASVSSVEVDNTETMLGSVYASLQPVVIENIGHEIRYSPISGASQSATIVPITSRDSLVGIIAIESKRLNAYTDDTVVLIQTLAGSLAAVIQNTLLVEQLQESNEQLREVDRLKSQFLASMSHELRTPLNSIIGFSRVMLKGIDGPLTEMQEQDLTTIFNSGNHLLRLINDILDQAKIEANEINLKFGYFDIKPLVESVKSIAIGLLKEKPQLTMEVEIAEGLPQAYGDEFRSRQILLNLVTNAIKFTQEGSVTIRVYAIEHEPAPLIRLDVIDTGMGIAESDLGTVFEQFRQVDNSLTRTVGGTGLGLPISKSFAELQGGDLTVASEVNVGSTFSVNIPTFEGAEEELERQREEKRAGQKAVSAQEPSITSSGLISKDDVAKAKQLADAKHQGNGHDTNGTVEFDMVDTQEFEATKKDKTGRIDTNVTQSIPIMTQKRDVILVEDDKTMVDQFRRILQREGFEVTTADFAAFAEAMIGQLRPNVVILDVNFANGTGWELLKNLKERDDTFDIPVVVTTMDDDSERAYRLGAHTFIQRPFLPEDVLEAVLKAEKESQRERILIIDDQEDTIRLLTHLLEEHSDFKIYSAQSGDEGISLVARRRPDLIILDLRMPGKDGFAVLDELRGNPETAKIPVLVVTGEMDLNNSEQEQLVDIHILQKTDISQEEYDLFIENVRSYLETNNGK